LHKLLRTWNFDGKAGLGVAAAGLAVATILNPATAFAQIAVSETMLDLTVIVQPIFAVIGAVIAGLLAIYVPRALAVLEARTRIALTDQQRATVLGAIQTAAGMIETNLDQGAMRLAHVDIANPAVRAEAANAINAVPNAAAALNMTVDGVARMIVGAVDTNKYRVATGVMTTAATTQQTR
jgi:hypothetical protein